MMWSEIIIVGILTIGWATSQPLEIGNRHETAPSEASHNYQLIGSTSELYDIYGRNEFEENTRGNRVRSDGIDNSTLVTMGVERPNSRLNRNRTSTSKTGIEQVHVFMVDKAREDAYQKTEAEDHPYSVVFRAHADGEVSICSGTLVSPRWVLTAAHCVIDSGVSRVEVFAGITFNIFTDRLPEKLPEGAQFRQSEDFYANPKYDPIPDNADFDVALIAIKPPFEITEYVKPLDIAVAPWNYTGMRECKLTAFGSVRSEKESPDDFIRKTQLLEAEKPCRCQSKLKKHMGDGPTSRYICMKPMQDFGICSGDSGGGLICDGEVKAIVSFTMKMPNVTSCKRRARFGRAGSWECGDVDAMSIFQDVYPSVGWIKKNALTLEGIGDSDDSGGNQRLTFNFYVCSLLFLTVRLFCSM